MIILYSGISLSQICMHAKLASCKVYNEPRPLCCNRRDTHTYTHTHTHSTADMKRAMKSSESKEQLVGDLRSRSGGRIMPMPVTVSGVSCVSFFWLSATFLLLSGLVIAGGFSNWISNRVERSPLRNPQRIELSNGLDSVDLGLYYLCFNLTACPDSICSDSCGASGFCGCHTYFTYNPATNFTNNGRTTPTNMKKVESVEEIKFLFSASIIYAIGIILLFISLMIGILAFCKPRIRGWSLFIFSFLFQVFAGKKTYTRSTHALL